MVQNVNGTWRTVTTTRPAYQPLPSRQFDPSLGAYDDPHPMGFSLSVPLQFDFAGPPPENCGAGYASLVRAPGGRTEQYPQGQLYPGSGIPSIWCNQPDAQAWAAQTAHVFKLVRAAWNSLMAAENENQNWDASRSLSAAVTAYDEQYAELPEPSVWMVFGGGGCSEVVAKMIANIKNGACQLDLLNRALAASGGGVIPIPDVPIPDAGGGGGAFALGGVAGIALAVGVAYLLLSSGRRAPARRAPARRRKRRAA